MYYRFEVQPRIRYRLPTLANEFVLAVFVVLAAVLALAYTPWSVPVVWVSFGLMTLFEHIVSNRADDPEYGLGFSVFVALLGAISFGLAVNDNVARKLQLR